MFHNRGKLYIIYSVALIFISLGFIYVRYLVANVKPIHIDQTSSYQDEEIYLTIDNPKGWLESMGLRANQYDFSLFNKTGYAQTDWKVQIKLPPKGRINDFWNIEFEVDDDNVVTIVPNEENLTIDSNASRGFGFILFSPLDQIFTEFSIDITPVYTIWDFTITYILIFITVVVLVSIIVNIAVYLNERRYIIRQEQDKQIILQSIKTFTNFVDAKDTYTRGHSSRVAFYSRIVAEEMNRFSEDEIEKIYYTALLHDVGKIGIPDNILSKQGKLTPDERSIIEDHPSRGAEMLRDFSSIDDVMDGAMYHHERYDGTGYPKGLVGEAIPLVARIICVADAYDAMSSNRCYRRALDQEFIIEELKRCKGTQFDPNIAELFLELLNKNAFDSANDMSL